MKQERGGTFIGFIVGVVVGLGAALAVAVYVTKVPVPFTNNKSQSRSVEQDEAEAKKNKNWDPNAPLYGKNPSKATPPAAQASAAASATPASSVSAPIGKGVSAVKPDDKTEVKPAVAADPLGDLVKAKSAGAAEEPFQYFVQVGAFRTSEDAEAQRAKLSLVGIEAKLSEREQSGRVVYRVRVGPYSKKEDADRSKEKLEKAGVETTLVRVQR